MIIDTAVRDYLEAIERFRDNPLIEPIDEDEIRGINALIFIAFTVPNPEYNGS